MDPITCEDLDRLYPGQIICCGSCHGEWAGGYAGEIDVELEDGRIALTCCGGQELLEEIGLKKRSIPPLSPYQTSKVETINLCNLGDLGDPSSSGELTLTINITIT